MCNFCQIYELSSSYLHRSICYDILRFVSVLWNKKEYGRRKKRRNGLCLLRSETKLLNALHCDERKKGENKVGEREREREREEGVK